MAKPKKSWREKLADAKDLPKIEPIPAHAPKAWGKGRLVIPAPRQVDALMRKVPKGKLTTIDDLRAALAAEHGVQVTCPATTGIFAWIAAHAAEEDLADGRQRVTPYWRTLKKDGEVNPKYPGGVEAVRAKLAAEGHETIAKGKRVLVVDYARKRAKLSS